MDTMRNFARWTIGCGFILWFVLWPLSIILATFHGMCDPKEAVVELSTPAVVAVVLTWVYLDIRRHRQRREMQELFEFPDDRE